MYSLNIAYENAYKILINNLIKVFISTITTGSLSMAAGGNIGITSNEIGSSSYSGPGNRSLTRDYVTSEVNVAGAAVMLSAGDFTLQGSKLRAGGDVAVMAGRVSVQSQVATEESERSWTTGKSGWGRSKKSHHEVSKHDRLVQAGIESGGRVSLAATESQRFTGAKIAAAAGTTISAPEVEVRSVGLTTQDIHTSSKKSTFHQSAKGRGSSATNAASTSFSGPVTVRADVLGIDAKRRERLREVKIGAFSEGATPRVAVSRVSDQRQNIRWHKSGLSPAAGAVVGTLAGAATALAGGFGASAGVFSAKAVAITAAEGMATSAAGRGAVALANNNFRLDKAAREVVAPGSARAILKTALSSAGVHGILGATGLGQPAAGMDFGARTAATLERFAIKGAVDGAVYGQSPREVAVNAASGGLLAIAQSTVGDVAAMTGLANGSVTKAGLHAAVGAGYSAALTGHATSGAIGGSVAEFASPYLPEGTAGSGFAATAASTASLLAGGDERAVTAAGMVAASEYEYNGILHPSPDDEVERQKQEQLERAGEHGIAGAKKSAKWAAEHPEEAMQLAEHALTAAQMLPAAAPAARAGLIAIGVGKGVKTIAGKLFGEPAPAEVLTNAGNFSGKTIEHMTGAEVTGFATTSRAREVVPAGVQVAQPGVAAAPVPVSSVAAPASAQPVHFEQAARADSNTTPYATFPIVKSWETTTGTQQNYKVYQRADIDWNQVRTGGNKHFIGKTNLEAGAYGLGPQLSDGSFATLHHIGQNAKGPLVEATTRIHSFGSEKLSNGKRAFELLHSQYGDRRSHPENKVDHRRFKQETTEYWKQRANNAKTE